MTDRPTLFLRPGGDKRLRQGHPWAYSNEITLDEAAKALAPGSLVTLSRVDGKPLGTGTFTPHGLIAFRRFDRRPDAAIDRAWLAGRLGRALALREKLYDTPHYRLVHGEADGLPGLVADRFGDVVTLQSGTAGMDALMPDVVAALEDLLSPRAVVLANDGPFRKLENLPRHRDLAAGALDGPLDGKVEIMEGGLRFLTDPLGGQKTGWYFDQRDNRSFMAGLARGASVLDTYCHAGGFALRALAAGAASAEGVDGSDAALDLARRSAALNGLADRATFTKGDVFTDLERRGALGQRFDIVIADPPAFVKSRKDLGSGARGYRKLADLAARLVAPGGLLFMASCSHNMPADRFLAEVAAGVGRAGKVARILRHGGAGPDHPQHPQLPESAYLKSLTLALD
ncbi:MAG: class I SAM-dependent rRNA methyltransferase [Rhodobacterales bacterium]|nr:class I SAM-dependent rRNA methyltransferase [Rhodobacterales bacterium]